MFCRLAVVAGMMLVVSACSPGSADDGASDSVAGPDAAESVADTTPVAQPGEAPAEKTVAEFDFADVLDGEPPSTTITDDPDAQAAADAAHWSSQAFFSCYRDLPGCDLDDFAEVSAGQQLGHDKGTFQGYLDRGDTIDPGAAPAESRVISVKKSDVSDSRYGVLTCSRNYFVVRNATGEIVDNTSPTALELRVVERDADVRWRVTNIQNISEVQAEEGGDTCSTFDGSEITDERFDELVN